MIKLEEHHTTIALSALRERLVWPKASPLQNAVETAHQVNTVTSRELMNTATVNYAPQDTEDGNAHGNVLPGEDSGALKALMEKLTKIRMPTWTAKESLKDLRRLHSIMYTHR